MTVAPRIWFGAIALSCVLFAGEVRAQDDVVKLKDGKEQIGRIKSEDWKSLEITVQKKPVTIPWEQVASINYGSSAELSRALDAIGGENFAEALTLLEGLKDPKEREPIRQQALYKIGLCLERQGKIDEAAASYSEVLKAFPGGRFVLPAGESLIGLEMSKGDPAAAAKMVDEITKAAQDAKADAATLAIYGLLKGRVAEAKNSVPEARAAYESVSKAAGVAPAIEQEARLGIGRTLQAERKASEAEALYRKLTTEATSSRVLAGAWNGLGDLLLEDGKTKRDQDKLLDALYCYLRGSVQYVPAKGETSLEFERAIAGSAKCFKFVAELEKNADRKKLFTARGQERLEALKRQFPTSRFLDGT